MPLFAKKKPANTSADISSSSNSTTNNNNHIAATAQPQQKQQQKQQQPPTDFPSPSPPLQPNSSTSTSSSPDKKSRGYFVKEREKDKRPKSPRSSRAQRRPSDSHPLNLPPEERRRLLAMSNSSSPRDERSDAMQTTPAPDTPGAFPADEVNNATNGVHSNGSENNNNSSNTSSNNNNNTNGDNDQRPAPPPHRTPASPPPSAAAAAPPPPEIKPEAAEAFKAAGNKLYKAGQYGSAIDEYTKAIEANPQSSTYLSNRAAAYMAANRFVEALDDCKRADELEPQNAKILHRLAKVYTALGRPQDALDVYDRTTPAATAKDRAPAATMQSHIAQAQDSLQNGTSGSMVLFALDQAEKGLGSTVQPPRKWRLMRGEAYLKMGTVNSLGDAQNVAMSLLRTNSADPEALVLRGRALYAQGDNEKAMQHFRQALACDPDFAAAVRYLRMVQKLDRMKEQGNAHFKAARYQQAVDVYTAALEVDPHNKGTNSKILNNRAMCHTKLQRFPAAIADADRAVQLDPSYTKARKTRAKALGESGDWEEAVRAYKQIQEHAPEDPSIAKEIRAAELELKKSQRKDYYKILGVGKDCGETDVKKAYRRLAVIHHPDKNPGDPEAENRFKDIQEAHETLIDPQKRERYDSGVDLMEPGEGFGGGGGFPGGMGGMGGMGGGIDPEVLFSFMSGAQGGGMGGGGGRGGGGFRFAGGGAPGGGNPFGGRGAGGFPFG